VSDLVIGLLSALMATNQPAAVSNLIHQKTGAKIEIADPNDPIEQAYRKLLIEDDAAQAEVNRWIDERTATGTANTDVAKAALQARIRARYEKVKTAYDEFLKAHPKHVNARIAYGSFLNEIGEEDASAAQLQKALEIDPGNPAALNNLANYHGHSGDVKKAFEYYAKAIEISPGESLYYQNFGTTVFLFRKDAMEFYRIDEQQVFAKAMALYRKALDLDPNNFLLATEVAQTYYGIKPAPSNDPKVKRSNEIKLAEEALNSWRRAQELAADELQRDGIKIHLARWQINAGRLEEARQLLNEVTNLVLASTKAPVERKLTNRQATNAPAPPKEDSVKP
jgi:tetratricopeptide (TPR) repeat protein